MSEVGTCCICGGIGKLTFEHVPPRAAFNDSRVFEADVRAMFDQNWSPGEAMPGHIAQKGAGRFSLCGQCNNDTGSWYGPPYIDFAKQAMRLVSASNGQMSLAYPYDIRPLRVLKQIVAMFFSACGPSLHKDQPELARFVLNKGEQTFPANVQIHAYLHHPTLSISHRQSGLTGVLIGKKTYFFSEIAFPPLGFVMSIDRPPIDDRLLGINYFAEYRFKDRSIAYLKMPVLAVVTAFPADFRTEAEVAATIAENKKLGSYFFDPPADWPGRR